LAGLLLTGVTGTNSPQPLEKNLFIICANLATFHLLHQLPRYYGTHIMKSFSKSPDIGGLVLTLNK